MTLIFKYPFIYRYMDRSNSLLTPLIYILNLRDLSCNLHLIIGIILNHKIFAYNPNLTDSGLYPYEQFRIFQNPSIIFYQQFHLTYNCQNWRAHNYIFRHSGHVRYHSMKFFFTGCAVFFSHKKATHSFMTILCVTLSAYALSGWSSLARASI